MAKKTECSQLQRLQQQLQKSFTVIQQSVKSWQESLLKCKPELNSIENLGEQYISCKEAPEYMIPMLNTLPDVKDKLLYKITTEINVKVVNIQTEMKSLKHVCDRVTKQCDYSMDMYRKHAGTIPINDITERTATCPSIADLLEWIQDTERLFLQQYHIKEHLLDKLNLNDKSTLSLLMNTWNKGDQAVLDQIQEYLCYTALFLEEKI